MSAPAVERIRPCTECGRMTRPATVAPRFTRLAYDVVFAVVPDARHPQQSDCRTSCCRNPYICRTGYACACHRKES